MSSELITAGLTLIGILATAYVSWRLGRLQIKQQASVEGNSREIEFREDLLQLIERQESTTKNQDQKIEKLTSLYESTKNLVDELKRANFNLTLENQLLRHQLEDVKKEAASLKLEVEKLKNGNHDR